MDHLRRKEHENVDVSRVNWLAKDVCG